MKKAIWSLQVQSYLPSHCLFSNIIGFKLFIVEWKKAWPSDNTVTTALLAHAVVLLAWH